MENAFSIDDYLNMSVKSTIAFGWKNHFCDDIIRFISSRHHTDTHMEHKTFHLDRRDEVEHTCLVRLDRLTLVIQLGIRIYSY